MFILRFPGCHEMRGPLHSYSLVPGSSVLCINEIGETDQINKFGEKPSDIVVSTSLCSLSINDQISLQVGLPASLQVGKDQDSQGEGQDCYVCQPVTVRLCFCLERLVILKLNVNYPLS